MQEYSDGEVGDGTDLTAYRPQIGTTGTYVDKALLFFLIRSRIVFFRTQENSVDCLQRARWTDIEDPDTITATNYVDAPTSDEIVGAKQMGEDIIVAFKRSWWKFIYTGDTDLPFRWEQIPSDEGTYATDSLVAFTDEVRALGPTRLLGCDGREIYPLDIKIPDILLSSNHASIPYSQAIIVRHLRQVWMTYTSLDAAENADGNTYPDKVIVQNYEDDSWCTYTLNAHCFGSYEEQTDPTWDEKGTADLLADEADFIFNEYTEQIGYPNLLMGDRSGWLHRINYGGSDNGTAIESYAFGGRWNPYSKDGKLAKLQKIMFLVDADSGIDMTVYLYINAEQAEYASETFNCADTGATGKEKVWKTIYSGAVADFHRIKIYNNQASQGWVIHAIVPYFAPIGRIVDG